MGIFQNKSEKIFLTGKKNSKLKKSRLSRNKNNAEIRLDVIFAPCLFGHLIFLIVRLRLHQLSVELASGTLEILAFSVDFSDSTLDLGRKLSNFLTWVTLQDFD